MYNMRHIKNVIVNDDFEFGKNLRVTDCNNDTV